MNDYIETRIDVVPCNVVATDILASLLCDIGFESFVPDDCGVTAYIKEGSYDADALDLQIKSFPLSGHHLSVSSKRIEGRDWNTEWEKNYFRPIVVGDQCVIHSSFHRDYPKCQYDIVIDPKMAFGTGHHATTSLIIKNLLNIDLVGKSVIDMGTGTGILAILAAMRGAYPVTAIEIDPFAHANAIENVSLNNHPEIDVILGDSAVLRSVIPADIFIANINRNVITEDIDRYAAAMKTDATILLSGFYIEDAELICQRAAKSGLSFCRMTDQDRWACIELKKQSDL